MAHVPDPERDEVASAQLAVDAQVEERKFAHPAFPPAWILTAARRQVNEAGRAASRAARPGRKGSFRVQPGTGTPGHERTIARDRRWGRQSWTTAPVGVVQNAGWWQSAVPRGCLAHSGKLAPCGNSRRPRTEIDSTTKGETMTDPTQVNETVQAHYTRSGLGSLILAALEQAGKDLNRLTPEDLAPIDEFHIRGRAATLELARIARVDSTKRVLDVGSGIGGTSRCLAREFGCRVTGIDLTEEYCSAAAVLSDRIGLAELVDYRQGDATSLPFPDASFDIVWTEHAAMNIPDKPRLYEEMHRVLKPGGTLAIYDILAGPSGPVLFPVPWARIPASSFLVTPDELRNLLHEAGFNIEAWLDTTDAARAWFVALAEKIRNEGMPPLGFHILLGSDFQAMAQNQRRNLEDGRIVLAQVVAKR
jgi:MPBQ/MSBQ methyltransferase